jgi:hypothetical protein
MMIDLHMEMQQQCTVSFRVAAVDNPNLVPEAGRSDKEPRDIKMLGWIGQRIWTGVAGTSPF